MTKNSKAVHPAFLTEEELFSALTQSAFEFLNKSIDEFNNSAKFSTIHFAIAIELFLKARLMREHWSLLLDKPDQASKEGFFRGDAKTVTPDQTIERLSRIASITIPSDARETFKSIAAHRNKMVHFAHVGEANEDGPEGRTSIAEEQCAGWLALRTLLNEWDEFADYERQIHTISWKMEGHRIYLQKVFDGVKQELEDHKKKHLKVANCPSCKFLSVKVEAAVGFIARSNCLVCRYSGTEVSLKCSNAMCGDIVIMTSSHLPPVKCPSCNAELTKAEAREALDTDPVTQDNYFDHIPINCPDCHGYHTVVQHQNLYICTECFQIDENYGVCGYCSEGQLGGVGEFSAWSGCEFCDGAVGNQKDD